LILPTKDEKRREERRKGGKEGGREGRREEGEYLQGEGGKA
jgi:hypothetical protein